MGITLPATAENAFSGSMQEYRDWLELLDTNTFFRHTLNPTSYVSSLSPSSSFDTLVRQYTLGSNVIGTDLSIPGTIISSSQPNQRMNDNQSVPLSAEAFHFLTSENTARGNFIPVEETYYIEGMSSGANNAKSSKIRFDDNRLIRDLSPVTNAERSKYDFASNDSNKLGLFYSYADQVNRDIFNSSGDTELDNFIGQPADQFEQDYPILKQSSQHYWKKYLNKTDINSYIRIFSQFDFAIFHQIKQMLAERIDEATGVLIEPHTLERAKARPQKRPSVEEPMYDVHYPEVVPTASGVVNDIDALVKDPRTIRSSSMGDMHDALLEDGRTVTDTVLVKEHLSLIDAEPNIKPTANIESLLFNITTAASQSRHLAIDPNSIITGSRRSSIHKEVVYHFRGSNLNDSLIKRNALHAASESIGLYYSRSLKDAEYFEDRTRKELAVKYIGTRLVGPGINEPSTVKALNNKPIIEVYETNPNQIIYTKQPVPSKKNNILNPGNIIIR